MTTVFPRQYWRMEEDCSFQFCTLMFWFCFLVLSCHHLFWQAYCTNDTLGTPSTSTQIFLLGALASNCADHLNRGSNLSQRFDTLTCNQCCGQKLKWLWVAVCCWWFTLCMRARYMPSLASSSFFIIFECHSDLRVGMLRASLTSPPLLPPLPPPRSMCLTPGPVPPEYKEPDLWTSLTLSKSFSLFLSTTSTSCLRLNFLLKHYKVPRTVSTFLFVFLAIPPIANSWGENRCVSVDATTNT